MTRRIVSLLLLTAFAAVGCGVSSETQPRALPPEAVGPLVAATPVETDFGATRIMALWFVADGELTRVDRQTDSAVASQDKIVALEAGPTQEELDSGMRTAVTSVVPDVPLVITAGTAGVGVEAGLGQIPVVLSDEFADLPSEEQLFVLGQVVTTLTDGTTNAVLFVSHDGTPVGVPLPDGRLANRPVTAMDYESLRS
jgi:hypothetical protein